MFVKMSVLAYPIALVTVFSSFIMFTTIEIVHFLFNLLPRSVKEVLESPGWLLKALSCLSSLRFLCTGNPENSCGLLSCDIHFTAVVWNQTWNISEVCLCNNIYFFILCIIDNIYI